jgi:hypothetical protein
VWGATLPRIEIYGSEGSISVPDPNIFGGPVLVRRMGRDRSGLKCHSAMHANVGRGIGVADMATPYNPGERIAPAANWHITCWT